MIIFTNESANGNKVQLFNSETIAWMQSCAFLNCFYQVSEINPRFKEEIKTEVFQLKQTQTL